MKKSLTPILIFCLLFASNTLAQKKKVPAKKSSTKRVAAQPVATPTSAVSAARVIGSTVSITTKDGNKLAGTLLDLSAYSLRLKADALESVIALETVAAITFDPTVTTQPEMPPVSEAFIKNFNAALTACQNMASETRSGSDYTDYGKQLTTLRRSLENFVLRFSASENAREAQIASLLSGALIDYTWARTIWTLKLGGDGTIGESDSPLMADTFATYPDLRATTASGTRFSADKLIGSLWKRASDKVERARTMVNR
ncbi:MAG: hypothetical protein AB1757_17995 [Acidobacteriota bacterium]